MNTSVLFSAEEAINEWEKPGFMYSQVVALVLSEVVLLSKLNKELTDAAQKDKVLCTGLLGRLPQGG